MSSKIEESGCDIICLQETKRESFDLEYLKKFCPRKFNKFEFLPSNGASGGLLTIWNGSLFKGELTFKNEFSLSVKFINNISSESWVISNIYGPCQADRKHLFIDWFSNIDMSDDLDWLIVGDFNFIRKPSDRNREGGEVNEMFMFNEAISKLGIVEFLSREGNIPRAICRKSLCLKD
jgi:exonuclease III